MIPVIILICSLFLEPPHVKPDWVAPLIEKIEFLKQRNQDYLDLIKGPAMFTVDMAQMMKRDPLLFSITNAFSTAVGIQLSAPSLRDLPPLLEIKMPCGSSYEIRFGDTLPTNSVPCSCGNTNHWFIRIETDL